MGGCRTLLCIALGTSVWQKLLVRSPEHGAADRPVCHDQAEQKSQKSQQDLLALDLMCGTQGLVTLFVMIGLGIVFGLPYLVARNRRMRKERSSRAEPSALSNILELSRKRDHTN